MNVLPPLAQCETLSHYQDDKTTILYSHQDAAFNIYTEAGFKGLFCLRELLKSEDHKMLLTLIPLPPRTGGRSKVHSIGQNECIRTTMSLLFLLPLEMAI